MGKKIPSTPFGFFPRDGDGFSLGGVYSALELPNGKFHQSFAIITTECNDLIEKIHHDRSPVIIPPVAEATWLNSKAKQADYVVRMAPYPSKEMRGYQLGPAINNWRNDNPSILKPVGELR